MLAYQHGNHIRTRTEIFSTSGNTHGGDAENLHQAAQHNGESEPVVLPRYGQRVFRKSKTRTKNTEEDRHNKFLEIFRLGVDDGVFRKDVNYTITSKIFKIRMESLKRMEELFPPDSLCSTSTTA